MIDLTGTIVKIWPGDFPPGVSVYLDEDLNLWRSMRIAEHAGPAGAGGAIQKLDWDGNVLWEYEYFSEGEYMQHHDFEVLPNGNVLLVAWDYYSDRDAMKQGRNPDYLSHDLFLPDAIIEVQPTGPDTGTIVWEWHAWDHMIQDFSHWKANFGVVEDHPELIDLNYPPGPTDNDWNHINGIDYNPALDQIIVSAHHFHEIWVIDHSTTTAEAAGHTGGNSGMGGDLIYRWGNPEAYRAGTTADRQLFGQHDATWIEPGLPGENNVLVFNNGLGRPAGPFSSIEEIVTPVDAFGNYNHTPGTAFGPAAPFWTYVAPNPTDFYSPFISGCQRLPNGNTLVCSGVQGWFFEVSPTDELVWEHQSLLPDGENIWVFKVRRYDVCIRPENYCTTSPNSVGPGALIDFTGTGSVSDNDFALTASGGPPGEFALFFYGTDKVSVPFGEGTRCAGGGIHRLGTVLFDAAGDIAWPLDITSPPEPSGQITVGSQWHFQVWYRDPAGGPSGFNFSDGLSVRFCP